MQAYSANGFFKPGCHQTARNTMQGKTEVFESYISMDYFITWLCDNYLFRHLLTYLLTYFSYLSLFLYFFISLFALDIQLVVRRRESPLGLPPPSPDSVPTGEELWKALKCDPVDKQRVETLLKSRAPANFREPGSLQVSYKT